MSRNNNGESTGNIILALIFLLLMIPAIMLRVYVFTQAWSWFAVPMGAPAFTSWWQAYGLLLLVTLFSTKVTDGQKVPDDERSMAERAGHRVANHVCLSLFIWGWCALVFHIFIN